MLILVPILITLLMPLVVFGLSFLQIRRGYLWLLATVSTFTALVLVLVSFNKIPISIPIASWQPDIIFVTSPMLLVDSISWPFAIAILALALVSLLLDVVHVDNLDPQIWASILSLGGIGLIAVVAGNPLTMLITWAVIDIAECVVLLYRMSSSSERERVVVSFSLRIAGIVLLISAMLRAQGLGVPLTYGEIPNQVGGLLMLASGLRLGVLPPNQPYLQEPLMRRNLGTMLRFVPSGASIVLLVRVAQVELTGSWFLIIVTMATFTALLSAIVWLHAEDELQGRPYWILGISAFSMAAAAQGLPNASSAWGLAMIFSGALLFMFFKNYKWAILLPAIGVIGISTLPLTPTWEGSVQIFSMPWGFRAILMLAQALMIIGYLRFAILAKPNNGRFENWMLLIYPIGLVLLPITHYGLFYFLWMLGIQAISFQTPGWWSGLISIGVAAIIIVINRYKPISARPLLSRFASFIKWIYRSLWWGYRALGQFMYIVTRILEGDGSVLWALLILILLTVSISLSGNGEIFGF